MSNPANSVSPEHKAKRRKRFIKYVLPSTLSMISIFLFTVVDGIFVGQGVGQDAVGAVNIAFPYVMIFSALLMLVTIGGLTITAIRKGREDVSGMNQSFMYSFWMAMVISVLFTVLGTVFVKQVSLLMGANENFFDMVCDYIFWYSVFMIPCGLLINLNGAVRNDGDPVRVFISTAVSTGLNVFGDWLFIFPLHMGLTGAAVATGISQSVGLLITLTHFTGKKGVLRFGKVTRDKSLVGLIVKRGLPECVSQFNAPIVTILYNYVILDMLGNMAENAYAVIAYVASFAVAAFAGVGEGIQPLLGFCYGEKNETDLIWYRRVGIITSFTGSVLIIIAMAFVGRPICSLYGIDEATLEYTMIIMPKWSIGFAVEAITVIISAYLYSTTRTKQALWINILRSFLVDSLVILLMPRILGAESIWYAFLVYESIVLVIACIIMVRSDRKGIIGETLE